jgi:hypothetical protein
MNPEQVIKARVNAGHSYTACIAVKDAHADKASVEEQFKRSCVKEEEFNQSRFTNEYECTPCLLKPQSSSWRARPPVLARLRDACGRPQIKILTGMGRLSSL